MDVSMTAVYIGQYSEHANLQSIISKIKQHNFTELKVQIGTVTGNETNKIVWTNDMSGKSPLSSTAEQFRCIGNDDSGFSFDDNTRFGFSKTFMRSKSLRSALRTSFGQNSGMRKTVHFADSFGLDLVHQNYYDADDFTTELQRFGATFSAISKKNIKRPQNVTLSLSKFQQLTDAEISYLTSNQFVCLQCVEFVDMNIIGTISVLNITYEKQVYVRYTTDNWHTFADTAGRYKNSASDNTDKFTFIILLPTDFPIGATCEFCIRFICDGITYWDNNQGCNYIVHAG